ncbi:MAG: orotidine 5'-phosphate decarboxylase / HUMPS family protein, partial [Fimbriimonadaceae bacterium]
ISGGPAMVHAACEEANCYSEEAPNLVGVSVLTSLDQRVLTEHLGVNRTVEEQLVHLSKLGVDCGLDGIVCSVHEVEAVRKEIGHKIIVTPGIRPPGSRGDDQRRTGDARSALVAGADYLVIGRALTHSEDPEKVLQDYGLLEGSSN